MSRGAPDPTTPMRPARPSATEISGRGRAEAASNATDAGASRSEIDAWGSMGALVGAPSLVWGERQGRAVHPYRVAIAVAPDAAGDPRLLRSHCECPSRERPCKHARELAELWRAGVGVGAGPAPRWAARAAQPARPSPRAGAAAAATAAPSDAVSRRSEAAYEAIARGERLDADLADGLVWFEQWLGRRFLDGRLADGTAELGAETALAARALRDAGASPLAAAIADWPRAVKGRPVAEAAALIADEIGRAHLLGRAARRAEALTIATRADVARLVVGAPSRRRLLSHPTAPRRDGRWIRLARARRRCAGVERVESWWLVLDARDAGPGLEIAVLSDALSALSGDAAADDALSDPPPIWRAEMVFHPAPHPQAAVMADDAYMMAASPSEIAPTADHVFDRSVVSAARRWRSAVAAAPWTREIAVILSLAQAHRVDGQWRVWDPVGDSLPLSAEAGPDLAALSCEGAICAIGALTGRGFEPVAAWRGARLWRAGEGRLA